MKCHPLNKKILKYETVSSKNGKCVDLSSTASYAEIHCELSQGQEEIEEGREAQHTGRSQFALVQDGSCGVKAASSGTIPLEDSAILRPLPRPVQHYFP